MDNRGVKQIYQLCYICLVQESKLKPQKEVLEESLRDPEFRARWERTALARAVALEVIRFRYEKGLSQTEFGAMVDMKQPQVSRLEAGDLTPSIGTLVRVCGVIGIEMQITIRPGASNPGFELREVLQAQDAL